MGDAAAAKFRGPPSLEAPAARGCGGISFFGGQRLAELVRWDVREWWDAPAYVEETPAWRGLARLERWRREHAPHFTPDGLRDFLTAYAARRQPAALAAVGFTSDN